MMMNPIDRWWMPRAVCSALALGVSFGSLWAGPGLGQTVRGGRERITDTRPAAGVSLEGPASRPAANGAPSATKPATDGAGHTTRPAVGRSASDLQPWLTDLESAYAEAQRLNRPVFVWCGGKLCPWCQRLAADLRSPPVQNALARWTVVHLDVDRSPRQAASLGVDAIPALRVLTPTGSLVDSHNGYMAPYDLIPWLEKHYAQANPSLSADLTGTEAPNSPAVRRLIDELEQRDPIRREAAIRRLLPHPGAAAHAAGEAFARGPLAMRLSALELLLAWKAPVDGLDPWRPEMVTEERLSAVKAWATQTSEWPDAHPTELLPGALADARREITKYLEADSGAAAKVLRERLARHGPLLLPEVYEQLKAAASDQAHERLTGLRYRLVASDGLALGWPGGLERLASTDASTRHAAIEELVARVSAHDAPLLLELFSAADPLVREMSLRALQSIGGGEATEALAKLLNDPEPNVRAAVLKQLAESPSPRMVPRLVEYASGEKDPDLVVHAVRVLRETSGNEAVRGLTAMLKHESWRVRAEAAEALGERTGGSRGTSKEAMADAYVAILELLDDSDGFVVSRAVKALENADLSVAVEPLVKAVQKHPELAADLLEKMASNPEARLRAVGELRKLCGHEHAAVRAAAITQLCAVTQAKIDDQLRAALVDQSSQVRTAAARGLFQVCERQRPDAQARGEYESSVDVGNVVYLESSSGGALTRLLAGRSSVRRSSSATQPADAEGWLTAFRAGKGRPKWMEDTVAPLERMLTAEDLEERAAAALSLVPLGRDQGVAVLLAAAKADPALQDHAAAAIPWLPWEERLKLFSDLVALRPQAAQLAMIAQAMARRPDERAAGPLWDLIAGEDVSTELAGAVLDALRRLYFGDRFYDPSSVPLTDRKKAAEDAKKKALAGPPLQRVVALALLEAARRSEAAETARTILQDAQTSQELRRDAFQVLLLSESREQSRKEAMAGFSDKQPEIRKLALTYLVRGIDGLLALHDGQFYLYGDHSEVSSTVALGPGEGHKVAPLEPSKGLEANMVRPLLHDPDPEAAAYAGYLMVLLGHPDGFGPLERFWREHGRKDPALSRLVYRAIAAANDETRAPVLEEIYRAFDKDDDQIREFYWTIRNMEGEAILALRKQIRQEVGMSRLR